jgi:hypothetical protein
LLLGAAAAAWQASGGSVPRAGLAAAAPAAGDEDIRTTDPSIAVGNLAAQISGVEARIAGAPDDAALRAELAELLAARAQYTGRIADQERALQIAEALAGDLPDDPTALLARASRRAAFHRFSEALADVDRAAAAGAGATATDEVRASILQALGRYDEALAIRSATARRRPGTDSFGALASLQAERGAVDEATRLYAEARRSYRDVSPFPLAWLLFDEGLLHMRRGDLPRARALFAAAHRRLPSFAAAQCHLAEVEAELGQPERAVALLRPLAESADDPDAAGHLARILAAHGDAAAARRWRDRAAARFDALVARHPEAYADHAAEFWLNAGGDPDKALALAQRNLAARQTPRAYELVLAASLAAADTDVACATASQATRAAASSPSLADLIEQAAASCG